MHTREDDAMHITTTKQVIQNQGLKILVHGPAGSGKTRLCATTGDLERTLIISAEGGLLSLQDYDIDVVEVTSMRDMREVYRYLRREDHEYRWICLDSISEIAEAVLESEKSRCKDVRRAYGEMADTVFTLLRNFRDLPFHVVMTAKQGREEDGDRLLYVPLLPGRLLTQNIAYLFDEVFALRVERNGSGDLVRVLQTGATRTYEAKDRSGRLDMYEEPDLAALREKILGGSSEESSIDEQRDLEGEGSVDAGESLERGAPPSEGSEEGAPRESARGSSARTREAAEHSRRTQLKRRLYWLLKRAGVEREHIARYVRARSVEAVGVDEISEVPVARIEAWARQLQSLSEESRGDRLSERHRHVRAVLDAARGENASAGEAA